MRKAWFWLAWGDACSVSKVRRFRHKAGAAAPAPQAAPQAPSPLFQPARHKPRSGGRPKPAWVKEWALDFLAEGGVSYADVANAFNRQFGFLGLSLCRSTVQAWFKAFSVESLAIRQATRNRFPAHTASNMRWCLDATGKTDGSGQVQFILGVVDHGSRLNVLLQAVEAGTAKVILACLFEAISTYGKPKIIRTDNAAVFHSAAFESALAAAGIAHEFSVPGKPWQNGRIERLFLTLKQKPKAIIPTNFDALNTLLAQFRYWYNEVRAHKHLRGMTPSEVWRGVNIYKTGPTQMSRYSAWGGLLKGFHLRC